MILILSYYSYVLPLSHTKTILLLTLVPYYSYVFKFDRSNGFKRTCTATTNWLMKIYMPGKQIYSLGVVPLKMNMTYNKCFAYTSSIAFSRAQQQFPTGIDVMFSFPFPVTAGDFITVTLPGFTDGKSGQ